MVMQVFHGDDGDSFQQGPKGHSRTSELKAGGSGRRWFVDLQSETEGEDEKGSGDQVGSPYFLKFVPRPSVFEVNAPRPA